MEIYQIYLPDVEEMEKAQWEDIVQGRQDAGITCKCPYDMKTCRFPRNLNSSVWCQMCIQREEIVPKRNGTMYENTKKMNLQKKVHKKVTGQMHETHAGIKLDKCPKKVKTCCFPDKAKWWCVKCCKAADFEPEPSREKRERREQRAAARAAQHP